MKTTLLHIIFHLLIVLTFGQTQLLKDYNFDDGGYYILGTISSSDTNIHRDSLGEFYTNDIEILNKFKSDLTFTNPGKMHECGYDYKVFVCRNGEILESFSINLNCEEIFTEKGSFYFDPNLLRQFYGKLKNPFNQMHFFTTIQEANEFRNSIINDMNLIMAPFPKLNTFEGSFRFTYKCTDGANDCLDVDKKIYKSIEAEIKKKYPTELFFLTNVGGSLGTIEFEIIGSKYLYDSFDLYLLEKESYVEKWEPLVISLKTYWTTKMK